MVIYFHQMMGKTAFQMWLAGLIYMAVLHATTCNGVAIPDINNWASDLFGKANAQIEDNDASLNEMKIRFHRSESLGSRNRRALQDVISVQRVEPEQRFVTDESSLTIDSVQSVADFIPTTRAQNFLFFRLTPTNSEMITNSFQQTTIRDACLVAASSHKCENSSCSLLTKNEVPQLVNSWNPFLQAWAPTGPGTASSNLSKSIVGNGVVSLAHFSPDGKNDFIIPASYSSDIIASGVSSPNEQCGVIWHYDKTYSGYSKYQDCDWTTDGIRHVEPFKINGEQFVVFTGFVNRKYESEVLIKETFSNTSNFILKWTTRTVDNFNRSRPLGFFLSGGEKNGGRLSESDDGYNPSIGNNGGNTWQMFSDLTGVVHAHAFNIRGDMFLAFSEYISDDACATLDVSSVFPACWNVEIASHIFRYDRRRRNPRGDCQSDNIFDNCQYFQGEFVAHQKLQTNGARQMTSFDIRTTGRVEHFLVVAESHTNDLKSAMSTIYRWNGHRFAVFQQISTNYAEKIEYFEIDGQGHLAVVNRGCPPLERVSLEDTCNYTVGNDIGRTRIYRYDILREEFKLLDETQEFGELHALRSTSGSDGMLILDGPTQFPVGISFFQLERYDRDRLDFLDNKTYIAIANELILPTDTIGNCPNLSPSVCSRPENLFSIAASVEDGISSRIAQLTDRFSKIEADIERITAELSGGDSLAGTLMRRFDADLRLFGASSSVDFQIEGQHYLVVGFEEAYMTSEECVQYYVNRSSPDYACPHLEQDESIAIEFLCSLGCLGSSFNPIVRNHRTETIVFRIVDTQPYLQEVQRIPSLGVTALHVFQIFNQVTQDAYENCRKGHTCESTYDKKNGDLPVALVIVNGKSTCERDYLANQPLRNDPNRNTQIFRFNRNEQQFEQVNSFSMPCQETAITSFVNACQKYDEISVTTPLCAQYLAIAEDCTAFNEYKERIEDVKLPANFRIGFYILTNRTTLEYQRCQPYPDPGDERNHRESPCYQSIDPFRVAGNAALGDEHVYDFPDLLPANTHVRDDNTGYFPRLRNFPISSISFGVATAQKNIFSVEDRGQSGAEPLEDFSGLKRSTYSRNGRRKYEHLLAVTYPARHQTPQIFGLRALYPKRDACKRHHATTPRRREFELVQTVAGVSGGLQSLWIQRKSPRGDVRSYAIFPERFSRAATSSSLPLGFLSSVFVNEVCDEFTKFSRADNLIDGIENGGIFGPAPNILPGVTLPINDTEWCPYSDHPLHFEAWEAFENHYHPASPCKGRSHNPDGRNFAFIQRNYNRLPPASIRSPKHTLPIPPSGFAYRRQSSEYIILPTFQFSTQDYAALFNSKDHVLTKLQDLDTYQANSLSAKEICGPSSQLWLVFGHDGWDITFTPNGFPATGNPPSQKQYFYRWNDQYAVGNDGKSCTLEAAQDELSDRPRLSARLGCFEVIKLPPILNPGRAIASHIITGKTQLLIVQINNREGREEEIAPGFCKAGDPKLIPGVMTYTVATNIKDQGGVMCQMQLRDQAESRHRAQMQRNIDEALKKAQLALSLTPKGIPSTTASSQTTTNNIDSTNTNGTTATTTTIISATTTATTNTAAEPTTVAATTTAVTATATTTSATTTAATTTDPSAATTTATTATATTTTTAATSTDPSAASMTAATATATTITTATTTSTTSSEILSGSGTTFSTTQHISTFDFVSGSSVPTTTIDTSLSGETTPASAPATVIQKFYIIQQAPINFTLLDERYVTLETDQEIYGRKFFHEVNIDNLEIENEIYVEGDIDISGALTVAGNVDVFGTVDGVDVSLLQEQISEDNVQAQEQFIDVYQRLCKLESHVAVLNGTFFGTGTNHRNEHVECAAFVRETSCFPKVTLKPRGRHALLEELIADVEAQVQSVDASSSVQSARMYPENNKAYLVIEAASRIELSAAILQLNISSFFTPDFCDRKIGIMPPQGFAFILAPVRFLLIPCSLWDQLLLKQVKRSVAIELAYLAIRLTDVKIIGVQCDSLGSSTLSIQIAAAALFEEQVKTAIANEVTWSKVYAQLVSQVPHRFADIPEVVEYIPGFFAPPSNDREEDSSGSGEHM